MRSGSAVFSTWKCRSPRKRYGGLCERAKAIDNRAINYAVLASLVLHGVLLFGLSLNRQAQRAPSLPGLLVAHLAEPAPVKAAPQLEPPKPQAQEPPPPPVVKPPPPKPKPTPSPIAKAAPKIQEAKPAPVPPVPAAPAVEAPPPSAPPASSAPPVMSAPPATDPQPSAAPDFGTLSEYEKALRVVAARYKKYPRVARDNNWEGTVEVSMVIGANGLIKSISIKSSSGHDVLDQEALEMFRKAKPLVPIPSSLRGKEFTTVLLAIYELNKPGE
jgi:protein TonB